MPDDEIIDAEIDQPLAERTAISIIPGTCPDSHIANYKATQYAPPRQLLFIGGPLDGQTVRICADGRLHEHHTDSQRGSGLGDGPTYVYCPAVIQLKGKATVVYILQDHVLREEIPEERRLGNERTALETDRFGRVKLSATRERLSDGD